MTALDLTAAVIDKDADGAQLVAEELGVGPERQIHGDPAKYRTGIPMGRLTTPQDVADLALVLASDTSRFVTGQSWHVDGGQTLP